MKKVISTILALVMLATPLVGTVCFANEPLDNAGAYVQNQDRSEQCKRDRKTIVKIGKITGCIAVGTAAVMGATVAGLKIFEDALPEPIKELMPKWLGTPAKVDENSDDFAVYSKEPARVDENSNDPEVYSKEPARVDESSNDSVAGSTQSQSAANGIGQVNASNNDVNLVKDESADLDTFYWVKIVMGVFFLVCLLSFSAKTH